MARLANDQLGGNNGKAVHKENTKKCKVVLGAGKRCAASGKALQTESAAREI